MNLILGTRKGLAIFDRKDHGWSLTRHAFDGIPIQCVHIDAQKRIWVGLDHGHWGPKMAMSEDAGGSFRDIETPKYPEGEEVKPGKPASTKLIWAMASDEGRIFVGTEPGGLFRSDDDGVTFELVRGLWDHPSRVDHWFGGGRDEPAIHSIWLDPDDRNHYCIAISCAGTFVTRDDGKTWTPKNRGLSADFLPDDSVDVGHDPHLLAVHPKDPNRMWQQNHCGVFRTDDAGEQWVDVSTDEGTAFFGFAIGVDENDPDTAWIVPAVSDECRVAVDGALFVSRTSDGGENWTRLTDGLPQENAYDLVFRHAFANRGDELVFGTTTGNVFFSTDRGDSWKTLSNFLPPVYCVEFADLV